MLVICHAVVAVVAVCTMTTTDNADYADAGDEYDGGGCSAGVRAGVRTKY